MLWGRRGVRGRDRRSPVNVFSRKTPTTQIAKDSLIIASSKGSTKTANWEDTLALRALSTQKLLTVKWVPPTWSREIVLCAFPTFHLHFVLSEVYSGVKVRGDAEGLGPPTSDGKASPLTN